MGYSLTGDDRFGWVNASYVYGLELINMEMKRALGTLTPYDSFERAQLAKEEKLLQGLS